MRDSVARPKRRKLKTLILLLAYPLAEITAFVVVGGWIGLLPTLGLVILSAVLGILVLRQQASVAGRDLRGSLDNMRGAVTTLADGALITLGAILLILPGFISDLAAIPLLITPLRKALVSSLSSRVTRTKQRAPRGTDVPGGTIIDGTFYEVDPDASTQSPDDRPSGWTRH